MVDIAVHVVPVRTDGSHQGLFMGLKKKKARKEGEEIFDG